MILAIIKEGKLHIYKKRVTFSHAVLSLTPKSNDLVLTYHQLLFGN